MSRWPSVKASRLLASLLKTGWSVKRQSGGSHKTLQRQGWPDYVFPFESLMDARENTPEGDQFDILATLVEAYERKTCPMELPDPVEAIRFYMEQNGMTPKDLAPAIGRRNRVHEVLNHTRPLTLKMIRKLHGQFGIPAESLIRAD